MGTSAAPVVPVETNDKSTPTIVEHTAEAGMHKVIPLYIQYTIF